MLLMAVSGQATVTGGGEGLCPMAHMTPDRLPDLHTPRSGHNTFFVNGELTVVGGHTTHFVPTPTAEYFDGEEWHQMPMAYSHDNGFAVALQSGEVIVGGGHEEPLGIGQTFMLERYIAAVHAFEGFGCLDRRRSLANAAELQDGRVIIAGNHYAADAIACYNGSSQVEHIGNVVQGHSNPYILPTSDGGTIILGGRDTRDDMIDTVWVDRVNGDAFRVPLLEQWKLVYTDQPFCSEACRIGQFQPQGGKDSPSQPKRPYSYLLTATDKQGQLGIIMVEDTSFSLLPTVCPIPMQGPSGPIFYKGPVVVDKKNQRGYVMGVDSLYIHQFVLAVDLTASPSPLTLYYTDSLEHATITIPVVTPEGDLILAGGITNDNYKPLSSVWCYHFSPATTATSILPIKGLWVVIAIMALAVLVCAIIIIRRRNERPDLHVKAISNDMTPLADDKKTVELMERISRLMDEELLYLRSDLKVQDVAVRLNTNSSYVSECINSYCHQSFTQFVNVYRVRHAQKLLCQQPNTKSATIALESGFSTESSFFRNFKAVTGKTPREWMLDYTKG